ncbi:MAG: ABC transporter related protein [Candidatus Parvarchaeum acidophilus ARMAN-5]|jgi:ABC-2 type transport system ATP-binding protein|uniref:ABC transporter related protein n=1 Tax=Candidatus Parvarchaeum acidophilus ARMAN-5 TaxID=662762 RepID=D6GUR5_PARA5|nr:MAG: ABC transporter related protein [Candidatus Parvarchaeum acidophilus ARMAN-5]
MEISVKNVVKTFDGKLVLDSISFDVNGTGIVGYLGPNGAGKTTTFKILTNLAKADSGEVRINGIDTKDYRKALLNVSSLVGNPEPYDDMTIKEFLEFIGGIRSMSRKKVEERISVLKKDLALDDLNKNCGVLSKGNKQRVVIAAVLLPDTDILLLDEPTNGLDPVEAYDIKRILKKIGKKKLILLSSHIMEEVKELCRDIIVIDNGRIIAYGKTKSIERKFGKGRGLERAYINLVMGKHEN